MLHSLNSVHVIPRWDGSDAPGVLGSGASEIGETAFVLFDWYCERRSENDSRLLNRFSRRDLRQQIAAE